MIKGRRPPRYYDKKIYCGELWHSAMDGEHRTHKLRMRTTYEKALEGRPDKKTEIINHSKLVKYFYDIFHSYHNIPDAEQTEFKFRVQPIDGVPVWMKGTMDGITKIAPDGYIREIKVRGNCSDYETDRLPFSMQTMTYHSCFRKIFGFAAEGTEYHHIQRPMGNRNAPRQKKNETTQAYHERIVDQARESPDQFFRITKRPISNAEIDTFEAQFLAPTLRELGWWWICLCSNDLGSAFHRRTPWGLYSRLRHWEEDDYDGFYLGQQELPLDTSLTSEDI